MDPALLWCRPVAVALIQPLAWELPHATVVAQKSNNNDDDDDDDNNKYMTIHYVPN